MGNFVEKNCDQASHNVKQCVRTQSGSNLKYIEKFIEKECSHGWGGGMTILCHVCLVIKVTKQIVSSVPQKRKTALSSN
jgi:hypothetical protein